MEENWVKIFTTSRLHLAEIVKGVLEENDIRTILINKQDSSYLFGEIEVYSLKENALRAINIIKNNNL